MTHSSLFSNYQVVITSLGPDQYSWVRGRRTDTGEDAFIHGPDDESFPIKHLEPGMRVNTQSFREVEREGPTRWTTTALAMNLQTAEVRKYFSPYEDEEVIAEPVRPVQIAKKHRKEFARPRFNILRGKKVDQVIEAHQFEGKYAESEAIAHCIDLCIENNLV